MVEEKDIEPHSVPMWTSPQARLIKLLTHAEHWPPMPSKRTVADVQADDAVLGAEEAQTQLEPTALLRTLALVDKPLAPVVSPTYIG